MPLKTKGHFSYLFQPEELGRITLSAVRALEAVGTVRAVCKSESQASGSGVWVSTEASATHRNMYQMWRNFHNILLNEKQGPK